MTKLTGILGGVMAATMFGAIAVGAAAALYTSEKTVNVHLYSGNLSAGLYLKSLVRDEFGPDSSHPDADYILDKVVDISGYQGYNQETELVDLSVYDGKIFSDIKLVPGMTGTATFVIKNNSDVAFNYSVSAVNVSIIPSNANNSSSDPNQNFYEDMEITLPTEQAKLTKGQSAEFTVSYLFKDDGVDEDGIGLNNDAMDQSFSFDISVLCTQVAVRNNSSSNNNG